ncbi:hypothetical protein LQZ24_05010 [Fructobacillus sp. M1-13]|uniref:Uncharacterized protein n=1 Tax=Fructobacillus papyriferae TaxID=2713171 RepID=A0ABS5QQP8_9LACO|nr:hypothetical protein [Fructobacillus papyriferae]MBS9335530.1 hypothetical protein [Fructobacillus papyriferae]MCD2159380.1 hypothetical protein [Fructobacillus papyriferae]
MNHFYRKMHRTKFGCGLSLCVAFFSMVVICLFIYLSMKDNKINPWVNLARHIATIFNNAFLLFLAVPVFLIFFVLFLHDRNIFQDQNYDEVGTSLLKLCFGLTSLYSFMFMEWKIAACLITLVGFSYKFILEPFSETAESKKERQRQFVLKKKSFRRNLK